MDISEKTKHKEKDLVVIACGDLAKNALDCKFWEADTTVPKKEWKDKTLYVFRAWLTISDGKA